MSASLNDLENTLFNDPNFEENVSRFAGDAACQVVYITKERIAIIDDDGESAILALSAFTDKFKNPQRPTLPIGSPFLPHPLIPPPPFQPSP